jgi:drug/metabolite transporter (DMT)-like permease
MVDDQVAGTVLAAVGAALFSTKAIFIKLAYHEDLDASLMLAWRMIFSVPVFLVVGIWMARRSRRAHGTLPGARNIWLAALTGILGYTVSAWFDFKGLEFISAQLERLVLFTYPLFIMGLGAMFFGQATTRAGLTAAGVTYAGLAVVFGTDLPSGGWDTVIGTLLVLGCALTFAASQLFAKAQIAAIGTVFFTSISMVFGGLGAVLLHWLIDGDFGASPRFLVLSGGCAIFATVLPIFFINAGLARSSAQNVAMISTISPILTIGLAVVILGEAFGWTDAMGSALVLAGIGYYTLADQRAKAPAGLTDGG